MPPKPCDTLKMEEATLKQLKHIAVSTLFCMTPTLLSTTALFGDDHKIRRVLVISIDGMHALDFALWIKNNPGSALAGLAGRGVNFTNASTTKPSDSIPATVGIFTGGSPAIGGMYYDDAYNRAWFAPTNTTCSGTRGTLIDLKQGINLNPDGTGGVDPAKMPRQFVNGVCTAVLPHNMMRINTVFEVVRATLGRTAYSEKRPAYEFLNGPSGTGVVDLYTPEIACSPFVPSAPPATQCIDALKTYNQTINGVFYQGIKAAKDFDELRVVTVLREIDGKDHTGTQAVGVPVLFGMNFQSVNAAKKDSTLLKTGSPLIGGGYLDDIGTPNADLGDALTYIDGAIGRMVNELTVQGLTSTTAIIITAKHGETSLDPTKRFVESTSAIQTVLSANGFMPAAVAKLTEKSAALLWLTTQSQTSAVVNVLTTGPNEVTLNIAQILSGDSLKLLFPDPYNTVNPLLSDPAPPDIIIVPNPGTNYEPNGSVKAEHGGFNENETHVPLLVVGGLTSGHTVNPGIVRAPANTTQIAPTILELLNLDPNALQAVRLEDVKVLTGVKGDNGKSAH